MDDGNTGKQPTTGAFALIAGGVGSDPGDVPGSTLASASAVAADVGITMID